MVVAIHWRSSPDWVRANESFAPVRPSMDQAATLVATRGHRPESGLFQRAYRLTELVAVLLVAVDATNNPRSASSRHAGQSTGMTGGCSRSCAR